MPIQLSIEELTAKFKEGQSPRDYQLPTMQEVLTSLENDHDVAVQLPTGSGKSFIYIPLALAAASKGNRVCILAPTNLIVDQVTNEFLPYFHIEENPLIVKGIENYKCLYTNCKADYAICTPDMRSKVCEEKYCTCDVLEINKKLEESGIVVTNFHKFLSTPVKNQFDLIIIDDSHGFESAKDGKFISTINYRHIDAMFTKHDASNDLLAEVSGEFMDIFDNIFESVPPGKLDRRIGNDDIDKISKIKNVAELKQEMANFDDYDRNVCYDMLNFIDACKRSTLNTFYVIKEFYNSEDRTLSSLISRNSEEYQKMIIRKAFGDARVVFVSATMGDIQRHAEYCTNRNYNMVPLDLVPSIRPEKIENWFNGLKVFEIIDYPEKELDPAVLKTAEIIPKLKGKILLLFKNYRDQKRAQELLQKSITSEVTFIDDSYNTEAVQKLVKDGGIIMATASSRLWEGIDIKNLAHVFIFNLPFIRPPVYLEKKRQFPFTQRKMLIRLQQGIGRLIRKEEDTGICVVYAHNLRKYKNLTTFSDDYRKRIETITLSEVEESILKEVEKWK